MDEQAIPIDLEQFREGTGGDHDFEKELISAYLMDNVARIAAAHSALQSENLSLVHMAAHAIRGSSSTIGAVGMADIALKLEKIPHPLDVALVAEVLQELEDELEIVQNFLEREVGSQ